MSRPANPEVTAATLAALPAARTVVVEATTAVHVGDLAGASGAVDRFLTSSCDDSVQLAGRVNALMTLMVHTAAAVLRDAIPVRPGGVISVEPAADADATRRAALAAVTCAANADLPAAVDVLLVHVRQRTAEGCVAAPHGELVAELCVIVDELLSATAQRLGRS